MNFITTAPDLSSTTAEAKTKPSVSELLISHRFQAMNTEIEIIFPDSHPHLAQTTENWFRRCEAIFSRFVQESELSRINQSDSTWVFVSPWMAEVLSLAKYFWLKTNGLFSPFLLDALEKAGYSQSFDTIVHVGGTHPSTTIPHVNVSADPQSFHIFPALRLMERPPGLRIDLGGIVKGWSAQRLARYFQKELSIPRGLINAGGDLYAWGGYTNEEHWSIGVQHPWNDTDIGLIQIHCGAVATSNTLARRWHTPEGIQHHIIDPRTGKPSRSDLVQCTVASPSLIEAEVLAKVILILGQKDGVTFLKRYMETEDRPLMALLVTEKGKPIIITRNEITQQSEAIHP